MGDTRNLIQPKVCAVCGRVLDRIGPKRMPGPDDEWIHTAELVGQGDHVAVPVDYNDIPVRTMCDFCTNEAPISEAWTQPARDFKVPVINTMSLGGWAACAGCAKLVQQGKWSEIVDNYVRANPSAAHPQVMAWLRSMHAELRKNMTGPIRPWQAGDERSV